MTEYTWSALALRAQSVAEDGTTMMLLSSVECSATGTALPWEPAHCLPDINQSGWRMSVAMVTRQL